MDEADIRHVLEAERAASLARIESMTLEFDGIVEDSLYANADDEHDPEGSTIAFERARVTALIAGARSNLMELDRALARLTEGSYSVCEVCQGEIAPERLEARPATRTCMACAVAPNHPG
jgi:RNA polymerase-binding transcription factor DksA